MSFHLPAILFREARKRELMARRKENNVSGPERCVNPRCVDYGEIQDGPCTFPEWRVGPSDELVKAAAKELVVERGGIKYPKENDMDPHYPSGVSYYPVCDDCGDPVEWSDEHQRWEHAIAYGGTK